MYKCIPIHRTSACISINNVFNNNFFFSFFVYIFSSSVVSSRIWNARVQTSKKNTHKTYDRKNKRLKVLIMRVGFKILLLTLPITLGFHIQCIFCTHSLAHTLIRFPHAFVFVVVVPYMCISFEFLYYLYYVFGCV